MLRAEIRRLREEIRAVTDAASGRPPPQFSVADTDGQGNPVLRPVMPRRRAVRDALRGTRYPGLVLPLAAGSWLARAGLAHAKGAAAVSKVGMAAGAAALAVTAVTVSAQLAVYTTHTAPHFHAGRASAPAAATAPVAVVVPLARHRRRLRDTASPAAPSSQPVPSPSPSSSAPVSPEPEPGAPGGGLPTVPVPLPSPVRSAVNDVGQAVKHALGGTRQLLGPGGDLPGF